MYISVLMEVCDVYFSVDGLVDGGLYTTELTELIGGAATGKTQLCISTALAVTMETQQNVVYFDTGGGFDISRVQDILEAKHVNQKV